MGSDAEWSARSPADFQRRGDSSLPDDEGVVRHGLVESPLRLMGLDLMVPGFSTLCHHQKRLGGGHRFPPVNCCIFSSTAPGSRAMANGTRGVSSRSVWRKPVLRLLNEFICHRRTDVRCTPSRLPGSNVGYAPMLPELLDLIPGDQEIRSVTADGAYDTRKCHDTVAGRGANAFIPTRHLVALGEGVSLCCPNQLRGFLGLVVANSQNLMPHLCARYSNENSR